jgi:hypothetical protein
MLETMFELASLMLLSMFESVSSVLEYRYMTVCI